MAALIVGADLVQWSNVAHTTAIIAIIIITITIMPHHQPQLRHTIRIINITKDIPPLLINHP